MLGIGFAYRNTIGRAPNYVRYPVNGVLIGAMLGALALGGHSEIDVSPAKKVTLKDTFLFPDAKTCYGGFDTSVEGLKAKWTYKDPVSGHLGIVGKLGGKALDPSMSATFSGDIRTQICTNGKNVIEHYDAKTNTISVNIPNDALIADTGIANPASVKIATDNNLTGGLLKNFANDVSGLPFVDFHIPGVDNTNSKLGDLAAIVATEQGSESCAQTAWTSPYKDPTTGVTTPFSLAFKAKIKKEILREAAPFLPQTPNVNVVIPPTISIDSTAHTNYLALADKKDKAGINLPNPQSLDKMPCLPMDATAVPAGSN